MPSVRLLRRFAGLSAVWSLVAFGCSDDTTSQAPRSVGAPTSLVIAPAPPAAPLDADAEASLRASVEADPRCDPLDTASCLLPFPSDHLTSEDPTSPTGRRVALPTGQLASVSGVTLDPTEWNRNDGFSPGTPILAVVPNVDPVASKLPVIGDIAASMEAGSGSVLWDLDVGARIPHWAELDSATTDPAARALILRPAVALPEGHHVAVALSSLVTTAGEPAAASAAFSAYRDNRTTSIESIEARRPAMESMLGALAASGLNRSTLTLAWEFTVASTESLSGRMLAIRDDAFSKLGGRSPSFTVTGTVEGSGSSVAVTGTGSGTAALPDGIARRVLGTFSVPLYLSGDGGPGSTMTFDASGRTPVSSGATYAANFTCQIPAVALDGPGGATRAVVYGHGLLGSAGESENSQVARIAATNDMMYCATDWIGMSAGDIGNAVTVLGDISRFPTIADRLQQGMLNALFLARVMISPDGFGSAPPFRTAGGASIIDTASAYYDGNSQGGIMGGAVTALAQDWTNAVVGVPGMNYSTLLTRSVDFATYFAVLRGAYPDPLDQQIVYGVLQMLWDRGETNGYAQHLTDHPYPDTPRHRVVLDVAFGDHQVANVAAEVEARTIGARLRTPALADGRHPDARPFYGLEPIASYPYDGSALVYWDSGTLPAPPANVTPVASGDFDRVCGPLAAEQRERSEQCADPHEDPRRAPDSIEQKGEFFRPDGKIVDACDGAPCRSTPRFRLDY